MRIETETAPGRVQVLVEHHPALQVDAATVTAALHSVLADALALGAPTEPAPARAPESEPALESAPLAEAPGGASCSAAAGDAAEGPGGLLDREVQAAENESPENESPADGPVAAGEGRSEGGDPAAVGGGPAASPSRSSEQLRARAVRLLDAGCTDAQVCAELGVSRGQLLRWDDDLVADGELAARAELDPTDPAGPGPVLAAAGVMAGAAGGGR